MFYINRFNKVQASKVMEVLHNTGSLSTLTPRTMIASLVYFKDVKNLFKM